MLDKWSVSGVAPSTKKKLFGLLKVEVDRLLGYNLLGALFTIGTYIWDGLCLGNVFYSWILLRGVT